MNAKQATPHKELLRQLLDSNIPKTEREHAAVREIERLTELLEALESMVEMVEMNGFGKAYAMDIARAAIAKARGEA
jgi:hypothetical protein